MLVGADPQPRLTDHRANVSLRPSDAEDGDDHEKPRQHQEQVDAHPVRRQHVVHRSHDPELASGTAREVKENHQRNRHTADAVEYGEMSSERRSSQRHVSLRRSGARPSAD